MSLTPTIIGPANLYLGDCLDVLPTLAPGSIDCVVTDPPYGINHPCNFHGRGRGSLAACNDYPDVIGDDRPFDPAPLLALNVPTILWGGNHYADKLPASSGWLVWDKLRPDDLDQATVELAWTNCIKGARRFTHLWNGCMKDSEREENYHPTQKPVALMAWCLSLRWTNSLMAVCDPYMGAGSTAVACVKLGRSFVGCEISPRYFDIACKRIQDAVDDGALFAQPKAAEPDPALFAEGGAT